jgi:hypothetical protein
MLPVLIVSVFIGPAPVALAMADVCHAFHLSCAWAIRKSRQGCPRRLVPLRLRRGALRRAVLERGASSCLDALPQLGGGCVASVSGQQIPDLHDVLLALMLIKPALLSYRW